VIDPDKYYSNREVQALENFSKSTHYDWVNRGLFPKPTQARSSQGGDSWPCPD